MQNQDTAGNKCLKSMEVLYCGRMECLSEHYYGPQERSQYLMHFVISGKGEYHVKNEVYHLKAGEIFLIHPGETTYYIADKSDPWEYMWVAFDGYEAHDLVHRIGLEKTYCTRVKDEDSFRRDFEGIINEFQSMSDNEYKILSYFYSAMSQLDRSTKRASLEEEEHLSKAVEYINNNYKYPIKISDISRYIGIDRSYLYKLFMSEKNISPKQYLLTVRLSAAKQMLMTQQYSVSEIALACGFSDSASFCNSFRKATGKTPTQSVRESLSYSERNKT